MATPSTSQRREEIELEGKELELTERKAELAVYVIVALGSLAATIVCVFKAYPWPAPSVTGLTSAAALVLGRRRADRRSRSSG
jgi:hypothetical protein